MIIPIRTGSILPFHVYMSPCYIYIYIYIYIYYVNHTICCTLSLVALRKPRTFNTVSHQNASDPVAPLQAQGAPFSGQWVGKGFSAWPFSFGRARRPLERLIGISRIAGGIEAGIIYHCLFLGVVKPWSLAIVEKVAVLRRSCQWGWTSLVNHTGSGATANQKA